MDSKLEALYQPAIALVLVVIAAILVYKGVAVPEWLVGLAILAISAVFHQQALTSVIKSGAGQVDSAALAQAIVSQMPVTRDGSSLGTPPAVVAPAAVAPAQVDQVESPSRASR